ncbi:MAG: hypothetical protein JWN67_2506 [Actinomycetia bacterium]|nr:hypothetical protein [Actinomycetes bacterium]
MLLVLAVATGALAQATTGIGFTLLVVPACALFLDAGDVLGTVARLGLLVDLAVVWHGRRALDLGMAGRYLLPAGAAVPVALVASALVPERGLVVVAATVTLAGGLLLLRPDAVGRGRPVAAGFASGFLGVTIGMPGPPVALDTARQGLSPEATRASLAAFFAVVDVTAAVVHPAAAGIGVTALLLAGATVGLLAGHHVAHRVPGHEVRRGIAVLVVAGALAALARVAL